jgi:hypothetical protein
MTFDIATLVERVETLEAREAIWQLQMNYRRHLDNRDFEAYAALFASDGEWCGPFGSFVGQAAILEMLNNNLERFPVHERTYHLICNTVIDVDGSLATAESTQCYITRGDNDEPVVTYVGQYHDVLVKEDHDWRFKRRLASYDIPFTSPPFT